ncbi:MAG: stage 0 sporulation family protein [Clostridia bacterium]
MTEIVGVGFVKASKTYYFDPEGKEYKMGELVIVETARGLEMGHISIENRKVEDSEIVAPLKKIERRATKADLAKYRENLNKRESAMKVCEEKIRKHKLEMKLVDAEYTIDGSKVIFYFSAEGRIDFRELVKDLAAHFRMRIELRQIGVRDEARMLGGIGICGRPFCCSRWLHDFQPVSIKMAKQQNLSLNPSKISGSCGRLMCCLNFENKTYQELRKGMPNEGEQVATPDGPGKVTAVNLFEGSVNVRLFEKSKDKDAKETLLSQEVRTYFKQEVRRTDKKSHKKSRNEQNNVDPETMKELEKLTRD